ncbi:DUF6683 family protein [Chamaesiphon sp. VAR_48_metabat_135_sub]|uniref:DUF6683 family protein n=1 Tax=Chamaesiphon sp. VAR_48_metabat_135_sub TaxID=2964699 RepID=UPI00286D1F4E|nr:DUF6683 family protein [Chamaesiphon sp. VAR_48_metabat_135_sub]
MQNYLTANLIAKFRFFHKSGKDNIRQWFPDSEFNLIKLCTIPIFATIVLVVPKIAIADSSDYGGGWAVPSLDTAISIGRDAINRANFDREVLKNSGSTSSSNSNNNNPQQSTISSSSKKLASLEFKPSVKIRQQNISRFLAKLSANNPSTAGKTAQIPSANAVMVQIDKNMASVGLKSNNVADAYAVYWTNAWLGSRGRNEDLPKAQMIAVRNQAANALLLNPKFQSATNIQKQELAEALILQTVLISAFVSNAKSDPALMEKVKVAISQGAKGMGLDLDRMNLTPQGFKPIN